MGRRPLTIPLSERFPAPREPVRGEGTSLSDFGGPPREKRPRAQPSVPPKKQAKWMEEAQRFVERQDWEGAGPQHVIAAFAMAHERVYGFPPSDLADGRQHWVAVGAARRFMDAHFRGDVDAVLDFLAWTWKREGEREAWRRTNKQTGKVIGWRWQFHGSLLDDYRANLLRARGGK